MATPFIGAAGTGAWEKQQERQKRAGQRNTVYGQKERMSLKRCMGEGGNSPYNYTKKGRRDSSCRRSAKFFVREVRK